MPCDLYTHNIEYIVVRGREKHILPYRVKLPLTHTLRNVSVYEYVGQLMMHVQDTTLKRRIMKSVGTAFDEFRESFR